MKVILIRPPEINRVWVGIPRFFNAGVFLFPPLGIMQLKGHIEENTSHQVIIYDSLMHNSDYTKVTHFVKKVAPAVVGISTFTHSLLDVIKTAEAVKKADQAIHVVLGGPHTYAFPEESAHLLDSEYIDSIVLGDGEETFVSMLGALDNKSSFEGITGIIYKDKNGKKIKRGDCVYTDNLDTLSFAARDIYKVRDYYTPASHGGVMTTMITSRGCPHTCSFCDTSKKYRSRSIKNVVDEMMICARLGFGEIFFIDDTFNITKERVIRLSEEILKRGLEIKWGCKARCDNVDREMLKISKAAGCVRLHYGVETGVDRGLDSIEKKLSLSTIREAFIQTKKSGIRTVAYFMIGCPHEKNQSDIFETIDFAISLPADFAVFSLLSPYPDTAFYKEGAANGVINPGPWEDFIKKPVIKADLPTCWEEHFSKNELLGFLKSAHRQFYYRPQIMLKSLLGVHSFMELKRLVGGGLSLLKLESFNMVKGRL